MRCKTGVKVFSRMPPIGIRRAPEKFLGSTFTPHQKVSSSSSITLLLSNRHVERYSIVGSALVGCGWWIDTNRRISLLVGRTPPICRKSDQSLKFIETNACCFYHFKLVSILLVTVHSTRGSKDQT